LPILLKVGLVNAVDMISIRITQKNGGLK